MKVAARSFNAQDSIYCHKLGVDTVIMECSHIPGLDEKGYLEPDAISETSVVFRNGAQKWAQPVATSFVKRTAPLYSNTCFNAKVEKKR